MRSVLEVESIMNLSLTALPFHGIAQQGKGGSARQITGNPSVPVRIVPDKTGGLEIVL